MCLYLPVLARYLDVWILLPWDISILQNFLDTIANYFSQNISGYVKILGAFRITIEKLEKLGTVTNGMKISVNIL